MYLCFNLKCSHWTTFCLSDNSNKTVSITVRPRLNPHLLLLNEQTYHYSIPTRWFRKLISTKVTTNNSLCNHFIPCRAILKSNFTTLSPQKTLKSVVEYPFVLERKTSKSCWQYSLYITCICLNKLESSTNLVETDTASSSRHLRIIDLLQHVFHNYHPFRSEY